MPIHTTKMIVMGYDKENDILCNRSSYTHFIPLEELLFIKEKLDRTIDFAKNNNIEELNDQVMISQMEDLTQDIYKKKERKQTSIYLMIDQHSRYYKIGQSKDVMRREKTLQSEKPQIEIVFYYESYADIERKLHERQKS